VKDQEKKTRSNTQNGILYIVSTPIGNLGDITFRAVEILKSTPYVAVEKVSRTKKLLHHYQIQAQYISYREENRIRVTDKIIQLIRSGNDVALVSDAGTPGISDPGQYLIDKCIESGISVIPIPGASSILAALTKSGFPSDQFVFIGFLPRKGRKRTEVLGEISREKRTVVIFESPQRTIQTLTDMVEYIQERSVALCRELTKIHETCIRGTARELIDILKDNDRIKGEVVLIVSGLTQEPGEGAFVSDDVLMEKAEDIVREHSGKKTGILATMLSEETGVRKTRAYTMIVKARERNPE